MCKWALCAATLRVAEAAVPGVHTLAKGGDDDANDAGWGAGGWGEVNSEDETGGR